MNKTIYKIHEEENEIDDHLLDIIGNEFKFDHQKGLAEWIKNAADAYIRSNTPDDKQLLYIRLQDGTKEDALMECIDFVGMEIEDITKALKRWGDPEAAKRGLTKRVYGGHGNGGKFYMRQMFKQSYFITFKNGKLNVFGFSENKKYGFAEGLKELPMSPTEAINYAGLNELSIPVEIIQSITSGKTGFTVVRGVGPHGMTNKIQSGKMFETLRNHPQARRLFERMNVSVIHNGRTVYDRILPEQLQPKEGFEEPFEFLIPRELEYMEHGHKNKVLMFNDKFSQGKLVLKTSSEALIRGGRLGDLNRIDILGEIGVIASYDMYELGNSLYPQSVFIYGDCYCPILEDSEDDTVKNDRSKLISENPKTKALLFWIGERVNELAEKILDKEREEQQKMERKLSVSYNELLNKWSSRFMNQIRAQILVGPGQGEGYGTGSGGSSGSGGTPNTGDGGDKGSGKGDDAGGGNTPKKNPRAPRVLLSGIDIDPFSPIGDTLFLDPRQGIVYQRVQDVSEGIYWINTASPLAKAIIDKFTERSQQWRSYLFQRHVDILVKEALRDLFKKDPERFSPDSVDAEVFQRFLYKIHDSASNDLDAFLLEDKYETV